MKDLVKAINRLSKALEIQNSQLEQLRDKGNDSSNTMWMTLLCSMFNNNPWNCNKPSLHDMDVMCKV